MTVYSALEHGMKILLLAMAFLLSACATVVNFEKPTYDNSSKFPRISILVNNGVVGSVVSCGDFGCYEFPDKHHYYIYESLRSSEKFENVLVSEDGNGYQLLIQFSHFYSEENHVYFPKLFIGALTLFMVPIPIEGEFRAEFKLLKDRKPIKTYEYYEKKGELQWIFQARNRNMEAASEYFVSRFIQDAERDDVFNH